MLSKAMIFTLSALTVAAATAQTRQPAPEQAVGVVTGTNVYVRSGPGESYPCIKLSFPARVRVVGRQLGWLEIAPPKGCFSLISKRFVRAVGDVGTVAGTNVLVRAGSDLRPGRMDVIQTKLNTGEKVTIVGEREGYYKIVPPPGVYLWISSQYVRRMPAGTTLPTQPTTSTAPTTGRVVTTTQHDRMRSELAVFEAVEKALRAELKKPLEVRNLPALLVQYQAIKLAADSPLAPSVKARISFIKSEMELLKDIQEVARLIRDAEAGQAKLAADRRRLAGTLPVLAQLRKTYSAEGILSAASELFRGGPTGPKRYLIINLDTHRLSAYVQCTTGMVDLPRHVGAHVGVIGTPQYDEALRLHIIEVEQIVVLRPSPTPAPTPAPTTRPAPVVTPTTKPAPVVTPTTKPAPVVTPTTKPAPVVTPTTKPAPEPAPTTKPAPKTQPSEDPLPSTGLPMIDTTTKPASDTQINPDEYK